MSHEAAHSFLGPSSAERWMNCSGSTALIRRGGLPDTDDPDYRKNGSAAHAAAASCLTDGMDAWEVVGTTFEEVIVTAEMAQAVQVYLDVCRAKIKSKAFLVEHRIKIPEHPDGFGTGDFAHYDAEEHLLDIVDYKNGHLIVEVQENPQLMYYAYGFLQIWPDARRVRMTIVQPNGWHEDGPVREWSCVAEDICLWVEQQLIPAMNSSSDELMPGDWCRFCPANLRCPALHAAFKAIVAANPKEIVSASAASLGQAYMAFSAVKHYMKAVEDQVHTWLNRGKSVPGAKLVRAKSNRVWKDGAAEVVKARFGSEAFSEPVLKSPPQIEALGSAGKDIAGQWAYSPQGNLVVALETDKRQAVTVASAAETFAGAVAAEGALGLEDLL